MIVNKSYRIFSILISVIVFLLLIIQVNNALAQETQPEEITTPEEQFSPVVNSDEIQSKIDENTQENGNDQETESVKQKKFIPNGFIKIRQDNTISLVIDDSVDNFENKEYLPYIFYIIPEHCIKDDNEKAIMLYKTHCENFIEITVNDEGSYDFSVLEDSFLYGSRCVKDDKNCTEESDIEVSFITKEKFKSNNEKGIFDLDDINGLEYE
jgi:hypothetical protein